MWSRIAEIIVESILRHAQYGKQSVKPTAVGQTVQNCDNMEHCSLFGFFIVSRLKFGYLAKLIHGQLLEVGKQFVAVDSCDTRHFIDRDKHDIVLRAQYFGYLGMRQIKLCRIFNSFGI